MKIVFAVVTEIVKMLQKQLHMDPDISKTFQACLMKLGM